MVNISPCTHTIHPVPSSFLMIATFSSAAMSKLCFHLCCLELPFFLLTYKLQSSISEDKDNTLFPLNGDEFYMHCYPWKTKSQKGSLKNPKAVQE